MTLSLHAKQMVRSFGIWIRHSTAYLFDVLSEMVSTFQSPVAVCVFSLFFVACLKFPPPNVEVFAAYIFVYDFLRKGIVGSFQSKRFVNVSIL